MIPILSWHADLLSDLRLLGPVSHFDFDQREDVQGDFLGWREKLNEGLLTTFEQTHSRQPVDWLFAYVKGQQILGRAIRAIRERFGVPTVNMCLDDKQSWEWRTLGEQRGGSVDIVPAFDLWWTSARVTADWINAEGGHALYLPEGTDADSFPEGELPFTIPVSFAGAAYGRRRNMIEYLRRHSVPVQTFGRGWGRDSEVSKDRMVEVFRTSQINLGHGGAGFSESILNLKSRDFDIPCAGGGVYLTTFNPDLAPYWHIGREILCWHSYDDLLEQVRTYLKLPERCREIARRARQRCLREHRWIHRYMSLLETLGIIAPGCEPPVRRAEIQAVARRNDPGRTP